MNTILEEYKEDCVLMNEVYSPDGYGGYKTVYSEGVSFKAVIKQDTSLQAKIAEQQGVVDTFSVVTDKGFILKFPMVIKRTIDNTYLQITSESVNVPPDSSPLNMRKVSAKKFELPTN